MTILPDPSTGHLRLLCLRHYRVASTGLIFGSGCATCSDMSRQNIRPLTGWVSPDDDCTCKICRRQPPTLKDIVSNFVFTMCYNIDHFKVTRDIIFQHYVYAADSKRIDIKQLLPPDIPYITIQFGYRCYPNHPYHSSCSNGLPWHAAASRMFESEVDAVASICKHDNQF